MPDLTRRWCRQQAANALTWVRAAISAPPRLANAESPSEGQLIVLVLSRHCRGLVAAARSHTNPLYHLGSGCVGHDGVASASVWDERLTATVGGNGDERQ